MAQTRKKRRRKHRGTQAGTVEARGRTSKAAPKPTTRESARDRRAERMSKPPTWRGSLNRSAIAALLFGAVVILAFGQSPGSGLVLAAAMIVIYLPMTYYMDLFLYRRMQKRSQAKRAQR